MFRFDQLAERQKWSEEELPKRLLISCTDYPWKALASVYTKDMSAKQQCQNFKECLENGSGLGALDANTHFIIIKVLPEKDTCDEYESDLIAYAKIAFKNAEVSRRGRTWPRCILLCAAVHRILLTRSLIWVSNRWIRSPSAAVPPSSVSCIFVLLYAKMLLGVSSDVSSSSCALAAS